MLSVIVLNVAMLSVVMLNVVVPYKIPTMNRYILHQLQVIIILQCTTKKGS